MKENTKKIRKINFFFEIFPLILQHKFHYLFDFFSNLENKIISNHFKDIEIEDQIYICGYARSGTTAILNLINSTNKFGSLKYNSLPFVTLPFLWKKISLKIYDKNKDIYRYHDDEIKINSESPDSFEEIFWKNYIKSYYENFYKININDYLDDDFLYKYKIFLKKILFIEKKRKFLSKSNNNLFRINYLLKNFPSAKFIICIREPMEHCNSLLRVHNLFLKYNLQNNNFSKYLKNLGHFEFGQTRKTIEIGKFDMTNAYWNNNKDFEGYIQQWINIHSYIFELLQKMNKKNYIIIDNAEMINYPDGGIVKLSNFLKIDINFFNQNLIRKNKNHYDTKINSKLTFNALKVYRNLKSLIN